MFELADRLVGIYKTHDATKSVTINPKLFADMPMRPTSVGQLSSGRSEGTSGGGGDDRRGPGPEFDQPKDAEEDGEDKPGDRSKPPQKLGRRHVLADTTNIH